MRSGRKSDAATPDLRPWQLGALDAIAKSTLARSATFGGATALAAVYLHHRRSEDLDFFVRRPVRPAELLSVVGGLRRLGLDVEQRTVPPRQTLVLVEAGREIGHIDFALYPYEAVERPTAWRRLRVDSLRDMAVNKVQALVTRTRERDFVDLYFLLREGPERDIERLLGLARAKFEAGPNPITLAEKLLAVEQVADLPEMIRPVTLDELRRFFVDLARRLVRRGP